MKWYALAGFLILARHGEGGALKCTPGTSCIAEKEEKAPSTQITQDDKPNERVPGEQCLAGSEWESNCHYCRCSDSGIAECLKQDSCDKVIFAEPLKCKPNTTFHRDCNTCVCLENGLGLCTLEKCRRSPIPNKSEIKTGKECSVGSSWMSQCNSCGCNNDGYPFCTDMACPGQEAEPLMQCAPTTIWLNDCNTCWCTADGRAMCTRIGCDNISSRVGSEITERSATKEIPQPITKSLTNATKQKVCVAKRMFIKDCNTCWCNDDGTGFSCTRKICVPMSPDGVDGEDTEDEKLRIIKKECRPDEVFELDCNMCRCNPDGKSFSCTRRACLEQPEDKKNHTLSRKVRAFQQEAPKACQPGQEFRMDCNKCLCDNEGVNFSCTRIDCDALNNNHNAEAFSSARTKREVTEQVITKCVPGSVFDQGCNVCRCTEDGHHATCTMKRCIQQNEVDAHTPGQDPGFRCNPGEQFTRDCNDCTCSADGKSVFCTLRLCDQDLTPNI